MIRKYEKNCATNGQVDELATIKGGKNFDFSRRSRIINNIDSFIFDETRSKL
ncbi:hypothetical protein [Clostridium sp. DL1XJH146]